MKVTALELRNRLRSILDRLDGQEPILIEKHRKPRAVVLPLRLYRERFLDLQERPLRDELVREITESAQPAVRDTLAELRRLRYGDRETP